MRDDLPLGGAVGDLPGHGGAPRLDDYSPKRVTEIVHEQVVAAGLERPVVVGHSLGGVLATAYAAAFPAAKVINVDQVLLLGPFGDVIRAAEPVLRGPEWRRVWERMLAGMRIDALPPAARRLVETASDPRPDLLLGYWGDILRYTNEEVAAQRRAELASITERGIGYHWVTSGEPPAEYLRWLTEAAPGVEVTVLPGSHFPHLGYPAEVARLAL